ncbi:MAG TPA: UDP-3-O-(3-hydroxymyristoyl)glucosamine N-acyltransferase [Candidatus Acidoferrales bacterium]
MTERQPGTRNDHRTAGGLAKHLACVLQGDAGVRLTGVASPERAGPEDLIYLDSPRHVERAAQSRARCAITPHDLPIPGKTLLLVTQPKLAFARAAAWLVPPAPIAQGIHSTAVIADSAALGSGAAVGPFAVIEDGVEIGEQTQIGAFCFLGRGAKIGSGCRLHPRVTLYAGVQLGNDVVVHSGAVLGADGFGYVSGEGKHWKFPQAGGLEIGEESEIGANATIDRGSLEVTRLGAQVKIDNLVHIAHNVRVGERTLIAAQTGVAGSSTIGSDVLIGGQVGIADHCRLEDGCIAGAQAGIPTGKTIRRGQTVWGCPARPIERFKEQYVWYARLPELAERVRKLEGGRHEAKK